MGSVAVVQRRTPAAPRRTTSQKADQPLAGASLPLLAAFAALGTGMTFFALAADAFLTDSEGPLSLAVGAAGGSWAVLHTLWGINALRGETPMNRAAALLQRTVRFALPAVAAVALAALAWGALIAPAGIRSFNLTLASAVVLLLIQLSCHGAMRRIKPRSGPPSAGKLLAALFCSAVLVAGIATPGLAASTAGDFAVPHGEHGTAPVPLEHSGH